MSSQANFQLRLLNWFVLLVTLGLLVTIFAPFQFVLTFGMAALVVLLRLSMEMLHRYWIRYLLYFSILAAIITAGFFAENRFLLYFSILGLWAVWNFDFMIIEMKSQYNIRNEAALEKKFLLTMVLISISAFILMTLSSSIQLEFRFGVILLLGILLIFSLSRLLRVQWGNQE